MTSMRQAWVAMLVLTAFPYGHVCAVELSKMILINLTFILEYDVPIPQIKSRRRSCTSAAAIYHCFWRIC